MSDNLFNSTLYYQSKDEASKAFDLIVNYLNKKGLSRYETKISTSSTDLVYKSQDFNIKFPIGKTAGYSFFISYDISDRTISICEYGSWEFELFMYDGEHSKRNLEKWLELMEDWYDISNPFISYTDYEHVNGLNLRICTNGEGRNRIYDPTRIRIEKFNLINIFSNEFIVGLGREKFQKARNKAYIYKDLKKDGILIVPAPFFGSQPRYLYEPASLIDNNIISHGVL